MSETQGKKSDQRNQVIPGEGACGRCGKPEMMAFRYTVDEKSFGARWHPLSLRSEVTCKSAPQIPGWLSPESDSKIMEVETRCFGVMVKVQ